MQALVARELAWTAHHCATTSLLTAQLHILVPAEVAVQLGSWIELAQADWAGVGGLWSRHFNLGGAIKTRYWYSAGVLSVQIAVEL
jgi:hypothetical protein